MNLDHDAPVLDDEIKDNGPQAGYFPIIELPKQEKISMLPAIAYFLLNVTFLIGLCLAMYICLVWLRVM
jgi:hypothetical protein